MLLLKAKAEKKAATMAAAEKLLAAAMPVEMPAAVKLPVAAMPAEMPAETLAVVKLPEAMNN